MADFDNFDEVEGDALSEFDDFDEFDEFNEFNEEGFEDLVKPKNKPKNAETSLETLLKKIEAQEKMRSLYYVGTTLTAVASIVYSLMQAMNRTVGAAPEGVVVYGLTMGLSIWSIYSTLYLDSLESKKESIEKAMGYKPKNKLGDGETAGINLDDQASISGQVDSAEQ